MVERMDAPVRRPVRGGAVGAGEAAKEAIEGVILFVHDDDVTYGKTGRFVAASRRGGHGSGQGAPNGARPRRERDHETEKAGENETTQLHELAITRAALDRLENGHQLRTAKSLGCAAGGRWGLQRIV